jgi:hypothetical protein
VITDKVRLFVGKYENHPESCTYRPSQVFYGDTVDLDLDLDLDQDHKDFIRYLSDMTDYRNSLQICFYEFLEQANRWVAPEAFLTERPENIDVNDIPHPTAD